MRWSLNIGRNIITNVEDPSDVHDVVNERYVDNNYVNIGNFRPRLISTGGGWPAAHSSCEILIQQLNLYPKLLNLLSYSKQLI
jgi:hypothetical protein